MIAANPKILIIDIPLKKRRLMTNASAMEKKIRKRRIERDPMSKHLLLLKSRNILAL